MALIQRCSDSVAGIRARALSSLAQLVGNLSDNLKDCAVFRDALGIEGGKQGRTNDFLKKRCTDEKAVVRRAALLLITKLLTLSGGSLDPGILKIMGMTCSDPLISIRKAAISALSEVSLVLFVQGVIDLISFSCLVAFFCILCRSVSLV